MWCRQQLVPQAGDRELTAEADGSVSSPAWPAEAAAGPGVGGPLLSRCLWGTRKGLSLCPWLAVEGRKQGCGGREHLPPPAQRAVQPRGRAWGRPQSGLNFWSSGG